MKKLLIILTTVVLCLALCLSLTACGGSGGATATPDAENTENNDAPAGDDGSDDSSDDNAPAGASLEDFISSIQGQIDQMTSSLEESGMKLDVKADGNTLVYSYQFTTDVGDAETVKGALEEGMDAAASTFEGVLTSLKEAVPSAEAVVVEYLDMNGNVLLSKEYK